MQEIRQKKVAGIGLRIAAPKLGRALALLLLVCGVAAVAISYWSLRDRTTFRLRPGQAQLSTEVVGEITNLEHREMKGDRLWVLLKADRDIKFSDGHHRLENVYIEVYPDKGDLPDKISARETLTNEDQTQFLFTGNVQIETRDRLTAKAESIEYDVNTEVANVPTPVTFERENISGRADSASLTAKTKKLELKGAVEITVRPDAAGQPAAAAPAAALPKMSLRGQPVTVRSAQAVFDQMAMQINFSGGATAEQGRDVMSGETLAGQLTEQKRVKYITAKTGAYLRTLNEGRAAEVFGDQLDFYFDADQKLVAAHAIGNVRAKTIDADSDAELVAKDSADLEFTVQGDRSLLKEMRAGGRPILTLAAPKSKAGDPRAANKRLDGRRRAPLLARDGARPRTRRGQRQRRASGRAGAAHARRRPQAALRDHHQVLLLRGREPRAKLSTPRATRRPSSSPIRRPRSGARARSRRRRWPPSSCARRRTWNASTRPATRASSSASARSPRGR